MSSNENRCLYCMASKENNAVCPVCGTKNVEQQDPQFLAPGTMLHGKYLLGRVLGAGGFGITYLAWDCDLQVKVAIKEFFPRTTASRSQSTMSVTPFTGSAGEQFRTGLDKFIEEARVIAQFEGHPHIVGIRDFFRDNQTAYYVMAYLEGMTLKEYLARNTGAISFDLAMNFFIPVLDALKTVHKVGILHRDISPDNVFLTASGGVKVLDFGAARQTMGEAHSLSVILKPGYAPEEQYRTRGKQGAWTDIYAASAMLYRMLTGQLPPESLDRLENDTLVPPSALGIEIPPKAEAVLMMGLAIRAADRFSNVAAFEKALLQGSIEGGAAKISTPSQPQQQKPTVSAPLQAQPLSYAPPASADSAHPVSYAPPVYTSAVKGSSVSYIPPQAANTGYIPPQAPPSAPGHFNAPVPKKNKPYLAFSIIGIALAALIIVLVVALTSPEENNVVASLSTPLKTVFLTPEATQPATPVSTISSSTIQPVNTKQASVQTPSVPYADNIVFSNLAVGTELTDKNTSSVKGIATSFKPTQPQLVFRADFTIKKAASVTVSWYNEDTQQIWQEMLFDLTPQNKNLWHKVTLNKGYTWDLGTYWITIYDSNNVVLAETSFEIKK